MSAHHDPLTAAEVALAYELHQDGCSWRNIATGLGTNARALSVAVCRAMYKGLTSRLSRDARQ